MIDWGDEAKPRSRHGGRLGMDAMLKDARRGDLAAVVAHLRKDASLLRDKSLGHNRTFLWEATRGGHVSLVKHLLELGADPNVAGRVRSEIPVLLKPYCIARRYRRDELAELLLAGGTRLDIYCGCFLGDVADVERRVKAAPELVKSEQEEDSVWRVTPLHYAVAGGQETLVRWLVEQGAEVRRYTRLLCNIAARMKPELIPVLIGAGADADLAREWGRKTV